MAVGPQHIRHVSRSDRLLICNQLSGPGTDRSPPPFFPGGVCLSPGLSGSFALTEVTESFRETLRAPCCITVHSGGPSSTHNSLPGFSWRLHAGAPDCPLGLSGRFAPRISATDERAPLSVFTCFALHSFGACPPVHLIPSLICFERICRWVVSASWHSSAQSGFLNVNVPPAYGC